MVQYKVQYKGREGSIAHINEINNDRELQEAPESKIPAHLVSLAGDEGSRQAHDSYQQGCFHTFEASLSLDRYGSSSTRRISPSSVPATMRCTSPRRRRRLIRGINSVDQDLLAKKAARSKEGFVYIETFQNGRRTSRSASRPTSRCALRCHSFHLR